MQIKNETGITPRLVLLIIMVYNLAKFTKSSGYNS